MATTTKDNLKETAQATVSEQTGFGAYGGATLSQKNLTAAVDKPPASKTEGSLDFTDADKRWLKDLGITTTSPHSYHEAWRTDNEKYRYEHRKWSESMGGRVAMRSVSRGLVGAAFYSLANMYTSKALKGYTYNRDLQILGEKMDSPKGPLQIIARIIDRTAGEGIYQITKAATHGNEEKALNSIMFRNTRDFKHRDRKGPLTGRSLGSEAVAITFDFASMSFGDYMTRYFIGLTDPNARTHWMKDGHIDVPGGLRDLLKNTFRGVTYAAGEDIAVAIPYVYGMRMQRRVIDKFSPDFKLDFDLGLNGASYKIKNGKVVGDYQLEGMVDLMSRFSWYNVGTKMFRDAYSHVAGKMEDWWNGDRKLHMPHIDPHKITPANAGLAAAHGLRYLMRTTVKVMGYMAGATPFFFLTRTPQTKVRGVAIDQEGRGLLVRDVKGKPKPVKPGSYLSTDVVNGEGGFEGFKSRLYYSRDKDGTLGKVENYPFGEKRTDAYSNVYYDAKDGRPAPDHSIFTNTIEKYNYKAGTAVQNGLGGVHAWLKSKGVHLFSKTADKDLNKDIEGFARRYVNAAISYTPYFMMKTDILSAEWDTARTDMGIDRSLDGLGKSILGVFTLDSKKIHKGVTEFKAGMSESRRSLMREPFDDPRREEIAQRERWTADYEHGSNEAYQLNGVGKHPRPLNESDNNTKTFAQEKLKAKPVTPSTFTQLKTPESWAAQEALRKFQDTDTQGQSVH